MKDIALGLPSQKTFPPSLFVFVLAAPPAEVVQDLGARTVRERDLS